MAEYLRIMLVDYYNPAVTQKGSYNPLDRFQIYPYWSRDFEVCDWLGQL